MAWDDQYDPPEHWGYSEDSALDDILANDAYAQGLFTELYADPVSGADVRHALEDELQDYLLAEYDIDFESEFDWEGWRDWYEG